MPSINSLIEILEYKIESSQFDNDDPDEVSWDELVGILISQNEAIYIVDALKEYRSNLNSNA